MLVHELMAELAKQDPMAVAVSFNEDDQVYYPVAGVAADEMFQSAGYGIDGYALRRCDAVCEPGWKTEVFDPAIHTKIKTVSIG